VLTKPGRPPLLRFCGHDLTAAYSDVTDLKFLEMFKASQFQELAVWEWLTHAPPDLVMAHLNIDKEGESARHTEGNRGRDASLGLMAGRCARTRTSQLRLRFPGLRTPMRLPEAPSSAFVGVLGSSSSSDSGLAAAIQLCPELLPIEFAFP
jgi:hypothetical protein